MIQKNKVLCFDKDDTIDPTSDRILEFFNNKLGTHVTAGHHDDFPKLFNISEEKMYELFNEFAELDIMGNVPPFAGMYALFEELKSWGFRIVITTARPRPIYYEQTRRHLDRFFPGIFGADDLIMHNYPNEILHKVNKTEMVASVRGGMFIDDSPSKVKEVREAFPDILILFKEHPVDPVINISELPEGIIPVKDASDIKREIFKFFNIKEKSIDVEARTFTD